MTTIELEDRVAEQLQKIATLRKQSLSDVVQDFIVEYTEEEWAEKDKAWAELEGMFDDDISDLSSTIRETMSAIYARKTRDSD